MNDRQTGDMGPRNDVVVKVNGVTREYRMGAVTVRALQGVSLAIERGEMVAIIGPSGSGKSTLLGQIGGLDTPTGGRVEIDGVDITALENVALPAQFARRRRGKPLERARELLDLLGLGDRLGHRPAELSGGQQQRVAIARALVNRPALLLADEPTGNLDSAAGEQVLAALQQVRRETGTTLLLVTHDPAVASLAERIIRLEDGRIVAIEEAGT